MSLLEKVMRQISGGPGIYTDLRLTFGRLDYEVAYRIDRLRRQRMAARRLAKLETNLATRIAALRELSPRVAAADQASLQDQIGQLQWMLSQIRGEGPAPGMAPGDLAMSARTSTAQSAPSPTAPQPAILGLADLGSQTVEVRVPEMDSLDDVPVVGLHVQPGAEVMAGDPVVDLETDQAIVEIPVPAAGRVQDLVVKVGDRVSRGSLLLRLQTGAARTATPAAATAGGGEGVARPHLRPMATAKGATVPRLGTRSAPGTRDPGRGSGRTMKEIPIE